MLASAVLHIVVCTPDLNDPIPVRRQCGTLSPDNKALTRAGLRSQDSRDLSRCFSRGIQPERILAAYVKLISPLNVLGAVFNWKTLSPIMGDHVVAFQHRVTGVQPLFRQQIRDILLAAKPKMVAVESLHRISMMASARGTIAAPGKKVAAKRKLNESLAESAIGHVGKLLREEAAKLGIPTVFVAPHGTSQTCPRCGDRHPNNRESQAVFRCRNCSLYAHADWTAAVIIRNPAYVRHCEWESGHTPDVLTAPTGWREQPSGSEPRQPRLGLELSVFKPEGTATSSNRNRVCGPRSARRIQAASQGAKSVADSVSHGMHSRGC